MATIKERVKETMEYLPEDVSAEDVLSYIYSVGYCAICPKSGKCVLGTDVCEQEIAAAIDDVMYRIKIGEIK